MSRDFWKNVGLNLCFWLSLAFSCTFAIKPQWVLIGNGDIHQEPSILSRWLGLPCWEQIWNCILHIYRKLQAGRTRKTLPFFQSHVTTNILCFLDEDIAYRSLLRPYQESLCVHAQGLLQEGIVHVLCLILPLRGRHGMALAWWSSLKLEELNVGKETGAFNQNLSSQMLSFHAQVEGKWFVHLIITYLFKSLQNRNFCVMHHLFLVRTQDAWEPKSISSGVEEILKPSRQNRTRVTKKNSLRAWQCRTKMTV